MADSRPDFHASLLHRYIQAAWDDTGLEMIQMFYQFCHLENGNWIARDDVRELQEMHKARISDVAKNTSLKMMPAQKDRQWGPHPFGPSGAYFVAQNMTTKLKPSLIYLSIGYWGIPLSVKRINLFSKPKDSRWFDCLTSRDNMRYLGTIEDRNETIETYRLRSLDLHPDIEIVSHTGYRKLRHNPLPERAPSLETAQVNLMARLMLLFIEYIMTKWENMKAPSIGKEESREVTTQEQESDCPYCARGRCTEHEIRKARDLVSGAIVLPLYFDLSAHFDLTIPHLILFEDDLELICKDIEVAMRPVIFMYMQRHGEVDWQVGRDILLAMRGDIDPNPIFDERFADQSPEIYQSHLDCLRDLGDHVMSDFVLQV
ncbi:hypothetical protein DL95DRAFT_416282 [Leptodontidium sp. 2 PMI_412]|nr:hypothetical protein DL95DRAFT_416282 [Leptodontidium sp. 2 PMI_412]